MRPEQATVWYRRMSTLYAMGAWTLLGSLVLFGRKPSPLPDKEEQNESSTIDLPELPKGFYVETIVTYKEDVPVNEKIHNFLKSLTGGPGAES